MALGLPLASGVSPAFPPVTLASLAILRSTGYMATQFDEPKLGAAEQNSGGERLNAIGIKSLYFDQNLEDSLFTCCACNLFIDSFTAGPGYPFLRSHFHHSSRMLFCCSWHWPSHILAMPISSATHQDLFGSIESELQISEVNKVDLSGPGQSPRVKRPNRWIRPVRHPPFGRISTGCDAVPHQGSMNRAS